MRRYLSKKRILIIFSFLVTLASFVACKKDKLTEPSSNERSVLEEVCNTSDKIVERIRNFDYRLKQMKQGICRADYGVNIDSALWDIESLFNASFAFPDRVYIEKKKQELSFKLKVSDSRNVMMKDVSELYDDIIVSVRDAYRNDGIVSDKSLMSIVLNKGKIISGELEVKLLLFTGRVLQNNVGMKSESSGPFQEGDCWYFGEYGGSCDDPDIVYDAAKALEDMINFNYGSDAYRDAGNNRCIYVGMKNISLAGNEYWNAELDDYYIYYKVNCPDSLLYIDYKELNKYYYNMVDVIFDIVPNDSKYLSVMSQNPNFVEVSIDGMFSMDGKNTIHNHNTDIIYGSKHVIKKSQLSLHVDLLEY